MLSFNSVKKVLTLGSVCAVVVLALLLGAARNVESSPSLSIMEEKTTTPAITLTTKTNVAPVAMAAAKKTEETLPLLTLGKKNTLVLREPVTPESVATLQEKLMHMSGELKDKDVIYLVLDTPGGDIEAGNNLIDTAKGIKQKVKTVTLFAASMGFHIAQNLDERLVVESGMLMSHRAKAGGLAGEIPGNLITRTNSLLRMITKMEEKASARMGIGLQEYQNLIHDEYWVEGTDAVQGHAADKVILARCSSDLLGHSDVNIQTLFGPVKVTFSDCPLIRGPLAIDFSGLKIGNEGQKLQVQDAINTLLNDKEDFFRSYISTGTYQKYFL